MSTKLLKIVSVAVVGSGFLAGCLPSPANRGPGSDGRAGNSILASIDGMDKEDRKISGIQYLLQCDSSAGVTKEAVVGELVPGDDDSIKFAGEKIADGDKCALEIRIPAPTGDAADLFEWHSKPDDKKVGLLYGSSRSEVAARKLSLTLYTLYSRLVGPQFPSTYLVSFEATADVKVPAAPTASILCDNNKNYATSEYKKTSDTEGAFTFKLPVAGMKGVACSTFTVLEEAKAVFEGALDIAKYKYAEPKKDTAIDFDTRVKLSVKKTDSVVINTTAGKCINYDAAKSNCLDVRSVTLPRTKGFWAAKVMARGKNANEIITMYVAPGPQGFQIDTTGAVKTVVEMNKSLLKTATADEQKKFAWFNASIHPEFLAAEWVKSPSATGPLSKHVAKRADVEGLEFSHIDTVWVHGFNEVGETALNALTTARWFAMVKLTVGANSAEFVVTGSDDYFSSAARPAGDKFFTWDAVKADRDAKTGKFKVFAIKGGSMAPPACTAEKAFYVEELSTKYTDEMKPTPTRNATLDGCLVAPDKITKDFDAATTAVATLYNWGWKEVK